MNNNTQYKFMKYTTKKGRNKNTNVLVVFLLILVPNCIITFQFNSISQFLKESKYFETMEVRPDATERLSSRVKLATPFECKIKIENSRNDVNISRILLDDGDTF